MTDKQPTVKVPFAWRLVRPNNEQYRQQSIELEPISVVVNVLVPLSAEYIDNAIEMIQYQLQPQEHLETLPILTPKGMAHCLNALTDTLAVSEVENLVKDKDDEHWDDEPKKAELKEEKKSSDDEEDWGEGDNDKDEEKFDDNWE